MKRAFFAVAAGAIGALGAAGLMSAAPASAQTCGEDTPPLTPGRVVCLVNEQAGTFFMYVSPANQLDLFLNGNEDPESPTGRDGLGILDQPATFVNSVGEFLNGPVSPS